MGGDVEGTDEVLWKLVVNGDGEAFGALFDRHRDRVLRHALRVVGSGHAAEDVTAMVFYEAWRRREYVRMVNGSIVAWLLVTANNTIRNDLRQRRRYKNFLNRLPAPAHSPDIAEAFADEDQQEFEAITLDQAFARLRQADRNVLTLCVVEEMSIRDAATALGIPEGTVKSRLNRAKARLGDLFDEVSSTYAIDRQAAHERRPQ
ncbi:UNVERIFIED_ORG: RNA polymerase sigma factor (sigma-70 family) [Arthrobacter sp. UYCu721]